MSIQVPLLVIDRRHVTCLHCSQTRRVGTLKVRWRLYYEFICFDIPNIVRSPGCDHGHDEESRNGRDIKIDILDGYIQTPEVFRVISEKTESRRVTGTLPGEVMGIMGPSGERERGGWSGPARHYAYAYARLVLPTCFAHRWLAGVDTSPTYL